MVACIAFIALKLFQRRHPPQARSDAEAADTHTWTRGRKESGQAGRIKCRLHPPPLFGAPYPDATHWAVVSIEETVRRGSADTA